MIQLNYLNGEIVSSPAVLLKGQTSNYVQNGVVAITVNSNQVFPPQYYEVNNGCFRAIAHVAPGKNNLEIQVLSNAGLDANGKLVGKTKVVDTSAVEITYNELPNDKPVHFCVVVGSDSNGAYDMPRYKTSRGEVANIDTAIQRLKVAGRMMQAYTQEEMRLTGFSNRCFRFVEEQTNDMRNFGYSGQCKVPHSEVKVHVLRSPKTTAELRKLDYAQQYSKAKENGFLFSHAIDLIEHSEFIQPYKQRNTPIQATCMYLDAHWDQRNDVIVAHAALGGGNGSVKMAVFGSHGLHSYPIDWTHVTPALLDETELSKNEVANDCNECGTSWECFNICMGAYLHEIGHLLGCPHQIDGVMLRDYVWINRNFMTREGKCLRRRTNGKVIDASNTWDKECHWNRLDLVRFFYHDAFGLPIDNFGKISETYLNGKPKDSDAPTQYETINGIIVKGNENIYMVELVVEGLARYSTQFFPQSYGGKGFPSAISLDYDTCYRNLQGSGQKCSEKFDVRVLSFNGDVYIENFKSHAGKESITSDIGRGPIKAFKSTLCGRPTGPMKQINFDLRQVYKVRVYSGSALDGVKFYLQKGDAQAPIDAPPVPPRNYMLKFKSMISSAAAPSNVTPGGEVTIGNEKPHYSDFELSPGEHVSQFNVRSGAWVDALQIVTDKGRVSPWYGKAGGGHGTILQAPSQEYSIVGLYGYLGSWMEGIGILYAQV